jgi:ubiquinone/menaquinone biosynthesis C-methylase UbiE
MLKETELKDLFKSTIKEYNATDLSKLSGWVYNYSHFGYIELKTILKYFNANMWVLDVGTGRGIIPRVLSKFSDNVHTLDSRQVSGSAALKNLEKTNISTHNCDIENENLPFKDESFDLIFFGDVIEHLVHSPKHAISEFKRVLKTNGVIVSTTPNATRLTSRIRLLLGHSNWANIKEYYHSKWHYGHHHEYTPSEFRWVFEEVGLSFLEIIMVEENLRYEKFASAKDIKTQDRKLGIGKKDSILGWIVKKFLFALTSICSSFRGNMIIVFRKA